VFISLTNDLQSSLDLHKFVDDSTISEIISDDTSVMHQEAE